MSEANATVFVVDDDPSVLKGLSRLLRSAKLNAVTYPSAHEFLAKHDPHAAGCALLDVAMPGLDGMKLQDELAARNIRIPIIFLTGHGDIPMSVQAMKRGAVDFLTKPVNDEDLLKAVRDALERDRLDRALQAELADIRQRYETLTPREREVMAHVVSGQLNKETAGDLGTAEKTIKVHRGRVMEKMKVSSLAELVRLVERSKSTHP